MKCRHGYEYPQEGSDKHGPWLCNPDGSNPNCPRCEPDAWITTCYRKRPEPSIAEVTGSGKAGREEVQ